MDSESTVASLATLAFSMKFLTADEMLVNTYIYSTVIMKVFIPLIKELAAQSRPKWHIGGMI